MTEYATGTPQGDGRYRYFFGTTAAVTRNGSRYSSKRLTRRPPNS